jgi:hypothetical protein
MKALEPEKPNTNPAAQTPNKQEPGRSKVQKMKDDEASSTLQKDSKPSNILPWNPHKQ